MLRKIVFISFLLWLVVIALSDGYMFYCQRVLQQQVNDKTQQSQQMMHLLKKYQAELQQVLPGRIHNQCSVVHCTDERLVALIVKSLAKTALQLKRLNQHNQLIQVVTVGAIDQWFAWYISPRFVAYHLKTMTIKLDHKGNNPVETIILAKGGGHALTH